MGYMFFCIKSGATRGYFYYYFFRNLRPNYTTRRPGCFFLLWPLFARAPRHRFLEIFLLSGPGVQSVFVFVALRWAPRPFGGVRAKKNTTQGVFFFAPAPGKGRGRRSPEPARGQSKKHQPGCFFFAAAPAKGKGRRPVGRRHGATAKKKHPGWCFFLLWPRAGAQRGFSFPCLSPGPQQNKKTPWLVFFALAPCRHGASPSPAFPRGRSQKKTPWVVFFFLLRPRADAHSLTAGLGGDASPSPGWCLFFLLRPRPGPGGVFLCCGPAGSF